MDLPEFARNVDDPTAPKINDSRARQPSSGLGLHALGIFPLTFVGTLTALLGIGTALGNWHDRATADPNGFDDWAGLGIVVGCILTFIGLSLIVTAYAWAAVRRNR